MGQITEEQRTILEHFTCERLSANPDNRKLILDFTSEKGRSLVWYLQNKAWREETECKTAYYLVKNSENKIALFFSLKCGALFDPLDENSIQQDAKGFQKLLEVIQGINGEGQERELALQLLEQFRSGQNISLEEIKRRIKMTAQNAKELFLQLDHDKKNEENEQIIRVWHTYPGIELVHFCSNDSVKEAWKNYGIEHPMGEVLFWQFIPPIIHDIQRYAGCQYLFLFAADASEDGRLINYYDVALKFRKPTEIGTNKPRYDLCCEFMCEEIEELRKNRQAYFDNFNPDRDDVIA